MCVVYINLLRNPSLSLSLYVYNNLFIDVCVYVYIYIQLLRNPKVPYSLCLLYSAFGFMILRWMPSFFLGGG